MNYRSISTFEELLWESLGRLERQAAGVRSVLRDLKNSKSEKKDFEKYDEELKDLKQLKIPVDDMIKFLEDIRSKITDTEVHIYESMGVESRNKSGRSDSAQKNDSGCYSANSNLFTDSRLLTDRGSMFVTHPEDPEDGDISIQTSRPKPIQNEDTSKTLHIVEDSNC